MLDEPEALCRERSKRLYRAYREEEKLLTGKSAPMALRLAAEYPGKLFFYRFQDERITVKPHFFLHGYAGDPDEDERHRILTPVHLRTARWNLPTGRPLRRDAYRAVPIRGSSCNAERRFE